MVVKHLQLVQILNGSILNPWWMVSFPVSKILALQETVDAFSAFDTTCELTQDGKEGDKPPSIIMKPELQWLGVKDGADEIPFGCVEAWRKRREGGSKAGVRPGVQGKQRLQETGQPRDRLGREEEP